MYKLAQLVIFATAFLMTANMQIYIHSLRIGIYSWQIFLPVIPLQIALIAIIGSWKKLEVTTFLFLLWWCGLIFAVGASLLFVDNGGAAISRASAIVTVGLMSMSFLVASQNADIAKAGVYGVAAAMLLAAGISIIEFLNPEFNAIVDQRYERRSIDGKIQRVGGLHVNPNLNAIVMALGMFASTFFLPQKLRLLFCILVGFGIFTTVSRAGISTWALGILFLFLLGQFSSGRIIAKSIGILIFLGMGIALSLGKIPLLLEFTGLDEFMTPVMLERLSTNFFAQEDGSTSSRVELAKLAVELYSQNAMIGAGLGGSGQLGEWGIGSHNTVLEIAAELGTTGLLVYLSLIFLVLHTRSAKALAFLFLYFFCNMFIHGLLYKPTFAYILPMGVVMLSLLDQRQRHQSKKRSRKVRKKSRRLSSTRYASG